MKLLQIKEKQVLDLQCTFSWEPKNNIKINFMPYGPCADTLRGKKKPTTKKWQHKINIFYHEEPLSSFLPNNFIFYSFIAWLLEGKGLIIFFTSCSSLTLNKIKDYSNIIYALRK